MTRVHWNEYLAAMVRRTRPGKPERDGPAQPVEVPAIPLWRRPIAGLLLILLLGAVLRLAAFGTSPPGLNQDEAAEGWNAWCILKTGKDQVGRSWPLLYSRCHGSNRSTLFIYLLIPFEMIGGLSPVVNRLPSPFVGLLTIAAIYGVGRRLFGPAAGLLAALMLAMNPWHIQLSRWGHQAILCPLLAVAGVWGLLWMGLGLDGRRPQPKMVKAALAGLIWGLSTWAYPSSRVFGVVFFVLIGVVAWRAWVEYFNTPGGRRALAAFVVAGGALFAPMAYYHIAHPEIMSVRFRYSGLFKPTDSIATKLAKAAQRYPGHFGPDFLFVNGDRYPIQSPPGFGEFQWFMAPLMLAGLALAVWRARTSWAARVLLVWLVIYPIGDCLSDHRPLGEFSMHALRASPGICGLVLLAAFGAAAAGAWLWERQRALVFGLGGVLAVAASALNVRFLHFFYGEYNRLPHVYHIGYHVDLLEACDWIRPKLNDVDAVFFTTSLVNLPYCITLVGLKYDPHQWFRDVRVVDDRGQWDVYSRYGKIHFMYGGSFIPALKELQNNGRTDRVLFVVRPAEATRLRLKRPLHQIVGPNGQAVLWICGATL